MIKNSLLREVIFTYLILNSIGFASTPTSQPEEITSATEDAVKVDSFLKIYHPHQLYFENHTDVDIEVSVLLSDESAFIPANLKITRDTSIKYNAPDYAFVGGMVSSYSGTINLYRSGKHWVIDFSKEKSQPIEANEIIRPYFSLDYYNTTYGFDFALETALRHYLKLGLKLSYNPNSWFKTEKYQRYFEPEIHPFVDFLLQRPVWVALEEKAIEVTDDTTLEEAVYTLLYQLRYKVLPKRLILKTQEALDPVIRELLLKKGVLINYSETVLPLEKISGQFIEDRIPWFKKYRSIQPQDIVGKKFTFGVFEHNDSGPYVKHFTDFTLTQDGKIKPSPHANEVSYRFTADNHLEILDHEGIVTSLFLVKKESDTGIYGLLGKFMKCRQRHHFLCTVNDKAAISNLFSDFMFDTSSRFEVFYSPEAIRRYPYTGNDFERVAKILFPSDNTTLVPNYQKILKDGEDILQSKAQLPVEQRIERISHNLWLTNAERPSYPSAVLIELCADQLGKMDLRNTFLHWIWTNVSLPSLERELYLRDIAYCVRNPDEAFDNANIKNVCDVLMANKLFGIAVNPLKFSILEKFGGVVMDMGVILKPNFYDWLKQFSMIIFNVPECAMGTDIYCLSARAHHPLYKRMVNLISTLDDLSHAQRMLMKYSGLGDACWLGHIINFFLFGFRQEEETLLAEFGSGVWTQRSRTWVQGTAGNSVMKFEQRHQIQGKTQLPIFKYSL